MHEWRNQWMHEMHEWRSECMYEWMHKSMYESMHECMNKCMHEWADEWMHQWMNAWMNQLMHEWMHVDRITTDVASSKRAVCWTSVLVTSHSLNCTSWRANPILHWLDSCRTISYNVTLGKEIEWNECMALVGLPKSCMCPFESIDVMPFPTWLVYGMHTLFRQA